MLMDVFKIGILATAEYPGMQHYYASSISLVNEKGTCAEPSKLQSYVNYLLAWATKYSDPSMNVARAMALFEVRNPKPNLNS